MHRLRGGLAAQRATPSCRATEAGHRGFVGNRSGPPGSVERRGATARLFPAPAVPRGAGDKVLRKREESRKKLAETEKRDAEA
jgi:hypothetical protein